MLFGWLEKLGLNKPVQIPPSSNYPWHESLIICQSPNSCSRTRLEGGNVKNLTRQRLVKVGRRQFNPPCREIRESLTRVDPTCKGYPVKKGTYAPQCSRVPFFFPLWETLLPATHYFLTPYSFRWKEGKRINLSWRIKRWDLEGNIYCIEKWRTNLS